MRSYLDGRRMDDVAMERLRTFEADAVEKHPDGYWLGFSGGKDSGVVLDLAERAGVAFTAHFSYSAEAPETVAFCREHYPQVHIEKPSCSMWKLIETNGPPTRMHRWCCRALKERGGRGRIVVTGIRSAESHARAQRQMFEAIRKGPPGWLLHPILDWPTDAVWEYVREKKLPINPLYGEGFQRVGCVMCPKARRFHEHIARWPKMAAAYRKALAKRWATSDSAQARWRTPQEMYDWWITMDDKAPPLDDCGLFLFDVPLDSPAATGKIE